MDVDAIVWIGFGLSFLAAFGLSLFHLTLDRFSKIALSGFLEERNRPDRVRILERYDDIRTSVEFWRTVAIATFLIYGFLVLPGWSARPFLLFLAALGVFGIFFDILPRVLGAAAEGALLDLFLPAHRLFLAMAAPVLAIIRWLSARQELREEAAPDNREASDEEIETFLDEAEEEGIIEKGEDELLRSVVEFTDTIVREVMTSRVDMVCIRRDATIQKLRNLIIAEKYSRIPVYRDRVDNIDGLVMAKDLLAYSEARFDDSPIEPLVRPVAFVPEGMKVADLLDELQKSKQKMAIVVDEHGGVSGLVTMEDVVEEIVGEIQDEYDAEEVQIVRNGPGDITVSGDVKVEELEDVLERHLAKDDFLTASGLVIHALGRLPQKGEGLEISGLKIEVLDVDPKRIKKLRIRTHDQSQDSEDDEDD